MSRAEDFDIISQLPSGFPNITVWRVDKPNVKCAVDEMPKITFQPGDFITIAAGGCAQTGGLGKTWKRYVDPQGPNSNKYYHGQINVAGMTHGMTRLQNIQFGVEHQVPLSAPAGHIQLGYEDDGYGDNGYWGRDGDDGTGDQCRGLPNAYVIVAVRHGGTPPADPARLVLGGIPHSEFRHTGAWQFGNFNTDDMSWDSFTDAFNLGWTDYANPVTYVMFLAGRGMASSGNCAGMCIFADAGEKEWVVDNNITEAFWARFPQRQPVQYDINVCHWRQMSDYFVKNWIHSLATDSNQDIANKAQSDIARGNYGLISLSHGFGGHVVVPLAVERLSGGEIHIHVYNPNTPVTSLPEKESNFAPLVIKGGNWSFPMGSETWTQSDGWLAYIPYQIDDGWRDLVNGPGDLLQIVLGQGASVDQITDSSGRRLFVTPGVASKGNIDYSARGLGHEVIKMVRLSADVSLPPPQPTPVGPPKFGLHRASAETPQMSALAKQMLTEYTPEYGATHEVYYVTNRNLRDLTIQVSTPTPGTEVNFIVGSRQGFSEMRTQPADKAQRVQPNFVIHSIADLSSGVAMHDRASVPQKTIMIHGALQPQLKQMQIQRSPEIDAGTSDVELGASTSQAMELRRAGALQNLQIESRVIDSAGTMR
jgi:hypothetical protein